MTGQMDMQGQRNMDMEGDGGAGSTERPMSHHMVVFGRESVFMSHLPMFSMPEHAYQVILETELTGAGMNPEQVLSRRLATTSRRPVLHVRSEGVRAVRHLAHRRPFAEGNDFQW
jgi:hypothetical protein